MTSRAERKRRAESKLADTAVRYSKMVDLHFRDNENLQDAVTYMLTQADSDIRRNPQEAQVYRNAARKVIKTINEFLDAAKADERIDGFDED